MLSDVDAAAMGAGEIDLIRTKLLETKHEKLGVLAASVQLDSTDSLSGMQLHSAMQ